MPWKMKRQPVTNVPFWVWEDVDGKRLARIVKFGGEFVWSYTQNTNDVVTSMLGQEEKLKDAKRMAMNCFFGVRDFVESL